MFKRHKWLILRRLSQIIIIAVFLTGPFYGLWIAKGSLAYSVTFDFLYLTDPMILLQSWLGGASVTKDAIIGVIIVLVFYFLVGGRVYCSWVCPVNIITDTARWLHKKIDIKSSSKIKKTTRFYLLGVVFLVPLITGVVAWELINPVSTLFRGLIYGMGAGWFILLAVFLLDLFIAKDAWCGKLCPVGAFYSLVGTKSLLKMRADKRSDCDDCMDCYEVCPESKILKPVLKGEKNNIKPVITSPLCTSCGRCIDVCDKDVFKFGTRDS